MAVPYVAVVVAAAAAAVAGPVLASAAPLAFAAGRLLQ